MRKMYISQVDNKSFPIQAVFSLSLANDTWVKNYEEVRQEGSQERKQSDGNSFPHKVKSWEDSGKMIDRSWMDS